VTKIGNIELVTTGDWEEQEVANLERLQWRVELLNVELQTDEERQRQFHLRRRIVEVLADRVLITRDQDLRVVYKVDMPSILTYA